MTTAPVASAKRSLYSALGSARTLPPRVSRPVSRTVPQAPVSPLAAFRKLSGLSSGKHATVSWMLALGAAFLSTGLAGAGRPVMDTGYHLLVIQKPEASVEVEDITMADLQGEPAPESPPDATQPVAAEEMPPEPEEPMTEEDVVEIPDAAPIEDVVPLLEPKPERRDPPATRPQPQTQPRVRPAAAPAPARPAAAANTAPGGQGTGGAGGAGPGKGAGGRGKFPQPPYPASARAKGITGTVTLNISVSPGGEVAFVSVAGSSGSSELDSHAASWVQRRWRWPAGGVRKFRMPVTFRLR